MSKSPESEKVVDLLNNGYEQSEIVESLVSTGVSRQRARSLINEAEASRKQAQDSDPAGATSNAGAQGEKLPDDEQDSADETKLDSGQSVSLLRVFQGYCLSAIFVVSSVLYFWVQVDVSAPYNPASIVSPLSFGLGVPLLVVLAAVALSSLYQMLRLRSSGSAPFVLSLAMAMLYLAGSGSPANYANPQSLLEPTTSSVIYNVMKPNGIVALSGIGSALLLRRKMGRLALPSAFLPLVVIALSWGVFALELPGATDARADPRYGADARTPSLDGENLKFSKAASAPPMANRELALEAVKRMGFTASPVVSSAQELHRDELRPQSVPYTSCTYQRAGYAKSGGTALKQALNDWRYEEKVAASDYFRRSLESLCTMEGSSCPGDINYSREQRRHVELARDRRHQVSSLMPLSSSEAQMPDIDLNPACGSDEDVIGVNSIKCSGGPVTVEVEADGITGPVTIADARLRNTSTSRETGVPLKTFSSASGSGTFRIETPPYIDASINDDTYLEADLTYDSALAEQASIAVSCR